MSGGEFLAIRVIQEKRIITACNEIRLSRLREKGKRKESEKTGPFYSSLAEAFVFPRIIARARASEIDEMS